MTQQLPTSYVFRAEDPRAPSHEQWRSMEPTERARVVAMLPAHVPQDEAERLRAELEQRNAGLTAELNDERRQREHEQRRREDEQRRREEAERRLAEALAEIARRDERQG